MLEKDVAIIGTGPTGLFTIFECGVVGLNCVAFDILPHVGGQCSALYPEKNIYDIPGMPKIKAQTLIDQLVEQAAVFSPEYALAQKINSISGELGNFIINDTWKVKAIIIAAGAGAFIPNKPDIENIDKYSNIYYAVKNIKQFEGKKVVIAGGGDSALDWTVELAMNGAHVYLIHRRDKLRGAFATQEKIFALQDKGMVSIKMPFQIYTLEGNENILSHVVIRHLIESMHETYQEKLEADALLLFYGLSSDLGPIANWGISVERKHVPVSASDMSTSVPGIFAIGDISEYPGKMRLILTGFAEGARAAHSVWEALNPGLKMHFEHSTTKFEK